MLNNLLTKLTVATASVALSYIVMEVAPTQAATVTYDFDVNMESGFWAGDTYSGFFSYDDSSLTGVGVEEVAGIDFELNFPSFTLTEEDEIQYPEFPKVIFEDGIFKKLDYAVDNKEISSNTFLYFQISDNYSSYTIQNSEETLTGEATVYYILREEPPVPEPPTTGETPAPEPPSSGETPVPNPPTTGETPTSVPEPASIAGLFLLGMGFLFKKKASFQKAKEIAKV